MVVARGLNIRVFDSLNFLPMKLAAFPNTFGLSELLKGYFPHFLIEKINTALAPIMFQKAYRADDMSNNDRSSFLKYHDEKTRSGGVFDLRKEMDEYCRSDLGILRQACLQLMPQMLTHFSSLQWRVSA